jgi:hypothetical protein
MLDLALLLELEGVEPSETLVLRHRPVEPRLRRILPILAEEEPELFNLYQRSHSPRAESAVGRAQYIAAFIGHEPRRAVFVGLYERRGAIRMTPEESRQHPGYQKLVALGLSRWEDVDPRATALLFDLEPMEPLSRWKGKLVIEWPGSDRAWFRRPNADGNRFPVLAINQDSLLVTEMPTWRQLCLSWSDLHALPRSWEAALAQWRGVYFLFDTSDGKGYVGSAYGGENILGRWRGYASSGHGGNLLLRQRHPGSFVFSILQLLSQDTPPDEVLAIEADWKTRLHSRAPFGLNAN